jgi:division protein CdvB (Snf7/Vps24/ESCRT-III family)
MNKLQTKGLSLIAVLKIIEDIEESLKSLRDETGTIVKKNNVQLYLRIIRVCQH